MKIKPQAGIIQLKIDEAVIGALESTQQSAVEYGEVIAIGEGCTLKKGQKVFVKSWAVDIITHNGMKFYFCAEKTNGILAVLD